jgi:DNA-3-methyladenine glycosylase I
MEYHDREWGVAVHDDTKHFEFLVLESNQSGLSWLTVLRKCENFRQAYAGFAPAIVAAYAEKDVARLLDNPGIIRNRQKINAAINNSRKFLDIQREFGSFDRYMWAFAGDKPVINAWVRQADLPAHSVLSDTISADLKQRGFKFIGTTTIYAHIQAIGMVNDHLTDCFRYKEITSGTKS